ncbi:PilZ domain-containing protein [Vibrio sp. S9_S30]|uniref:PilZ domain-containing protein n=1 Tax=Vibrio sp. S9_S30 TaxID=2720226 RepID=UPI0016815501|nr:PilZ domain-containing protein [Vibrio sp. S9_S30]MBD1557672.1 PilZ domain-containing protein [Vibrio sp. S9_S30]
MSQTSVEQKRRYYRLRYPKQERPVLRIKDQYYHICEVSEKGIRVLMANVASLYRGLTMAGTLRLHGNMNVSVEGAVLRFDNDEVILQLSKGPSLKNMVEEQRHIRKKYPTFFSKQNQSPFAA